MRIALVLPGVGNLFYCDNCIRDRAMAIALNRMPPHEIVTVPLYLPLAAAAPGERRAPLFFGGINVFLMQKWPWYGRVPAPIMRGLDAGFLLDRVARMSRLMNPEDVAETTLSVLRGEDGRQARELRRLVDWLADRAQPDVVVLSDVLLAGMAPAIKARLHVPVISMLQDEDEFLDGLPASYREQAWDLVREKARGLDACVAVSRYYRLVIQERLQLPADRVHVVHPGILTGMYEPADRPPARPVIGYLSRACEEKGLDSLVHAFISLRRSGFSDLRLRIAGGQMAQDQALQHRLRQELAASELLADVEFLPNLDIAKRVDFLKQLTIFSVPEKKASAFRLYALEALACGIPVVEPRSGGFVELIELTHGGVLYDPNDPQALATALAKLLMDPEAIRRLGRAGRQAVMRGFDAGAAAGNLLRICQEAGARG